MKRIKEYKMSLMEKEGKSDQKGKYNFVVKCSALLQVNKMIDDNTVDEEYDDFILESASLIFEELHNQVKENGKIESLGLWITFNDGLEIDNSIDLSVLNDIKTYGEENINPVKEFFKMTVE
jgi:hypothetical protein